jgi:hypothetical protein
MALGSVEPQVVLGIGVGLFLKVTVDDKCCKRVHVCMCPWRFGGRRLSHRRGVVTSSDYGPFPDIEDLMPPPVLVGFAPSTKRKATEPAKTRNKELAKPTSKKPRVESNKSIRDFVTASTCKHSPQSARWCS